MDSLGYCELTIKNLSEADSYDVLGRRCADLSLLPIRHAAAALETNPSAIHIHNRNLQFFTHLTELSGIIQDLTPIRDELRRLSLKRAAPGRRHNNRIVLALPAPR